MQIRLATHSDADEGSLVLRRSIEELCHADHGGDPAIVAAWTGNKTPAMWRTWVDQGTSKLFVAVEEGHVLGVGMMDNSGAIMLNYVSPDARWKGVSKALLAHMEEEAASCGVNRCTLESTRTARAFYEAAGYCSRDDADDNDNRMTKSVIGSRLSVSIRVFSADDAEAFLKVHHAAVRGTAAKDYPASVIDAWAPAIQRKHIEAVKADSVSSRIVALHHDEIVGIGEVVPDAGELRACYVSPLHAGKGIGRAIVMELEDIARSKGALSLWLDSSLTAQMFYEKLGYVILELGEHRLQTGLSMACVRMSKAW